MMCRCRWINYSHAYCICILFLGYFTQLDQTRTRVAFAWHADLLYDQQVEHDDTCCFGGESFPTQPIVRVGGSSRHHSSMPLHPLTNFSGTLSVELYNHDEEEIKHEKQIVRLRGESLVSSIQNGTATFTGLYINEAGNGYRLHFVLRDEHNRKVAFLIGRRFTVNVGHAYQLGIIEQPGDAFGGNVFGIQPIVAIQDRGFNSISTWNEGTIGVSMFANNTNSLKFQQEPFQLGFELPVMNGVAPYHNLYINEESFGYKLLFKFSLPLEGPAEIESDEFTVQVGPPSKLVILDDPSFADVYGGKAFSRQPRVSVVDAGGNIVSNNSSLTICADVDQSYLGGSLSCATLHACNCRAARNGVAQFSGLKIDIHGDGYRIKYSLIIKSFEKDVKSGLDVIGPKFNVYIGSIFDVKFVREPSTALANNQPFVQQPSVSMVDRGGNMVKSTQNSSIVAFLVPSLSASSTIVIDTKSAPVPTILSVAYSPEYEVFPHIIVGPGDIVPIFVTFTDEVFLKDFDENDFLPSLELNVIDPSNSTNVRAILFKPCSVCRSNVLTFNYHVRVGHNIRALNYSSAYSLFPGGGVIVDTFGRPCDLEIPRSIAGISHISNSSVEVSDEIPVVIGVSSTAISGDYGAGEVLDIVVYFSREVAVFGQPNVPISVHSSLFLIDTFGSGVEVEPESYFYLIYGEEISNPIPWNATTKEFMKAIEMFSIFSGISPCVDRSKYQDTTDEIGGFRWVIRPNYLEKNNFERSEFRLSTEFMRVIDGGTIEMSITFITTNEPYEDWFSGKMCTQRKASYTSGSGSSFLTFQYTVMPGDMSSRLDVLKELSIETISLGAFISLSTFDNVPGGIHANASLQNFSLPVDLIIEIDTSPPLVELVSISSNQLQAHRFAVGDLFEIQVHFSKPVLVKGNIWMKLDVGPFSKPAPYIAGNSTRTLTFRHLVEPGQYSNRLDYYGENALIFSTEYDSYIRRFSTYPQVDAVSTLPTPGSSLSLSASYSIVVDGIRPTVLSVGFELGFEGKTYFTGDTVHIAITFSAPVIILGGPPVISILTGNGKERQVPYVYGNNTSTLVFEYLVQLGDYSNCLAYKYDASGALCVSEACPIVSIEDRILQLSSNSSLDVLLSMPIHGGNIEDGVCIGSGVTQVSIDGLEAKTSTVFIVQPSNRTGLYGPGDILCLNIITSDSIFVEGVPTLKSNLKAENHYFTYLNGSGSHHLSFCTALTIYDSTTNLEWLLVNGTNSAIICEDGACSMKNKIGGILDTRFVSDTGVSIVPSLGTVAHIEVNSDIPFIKAVTTDRDKSPYCLSSSNQCSFSIGEIINIFITFNVPVLVTNLQNPPYILLDVCENGAQAIFNNSLSGQNKLAFTYMVSHDHQSIDIPLNYMCHLDDCKIQNAYHIMRNATVPFLRANSTLPPPRELGVSKDKDNKIFIRTHSVPKVVNATVNKCGGYLSPGDIVDILVLFDQVVIVTGFPFILLDVSVENTTAIYIDGSNSTELRFQYTVQPFHKAIHFDYVDRNSIHLSENSSILMASSIPQVEADLRLSVPGERGSISFNCNLSIDGSVPFITSITSAKNEGNFTTGKVINIYIRFSHDIVVYGIPSLLLETGTIDREAIFTEMYGNNTLSLSYVVQLGDMSRLLDYWVSDGLKRSSASSIKLNGGWIRRKSQNPIVDADIHINPAVGTLAGITSIKTNNGLSNFVDLRISQRGYDYKLYFLAEIPNSNRFIASCSSIINVEPSAEFQLTENDESREQNDLYGKSVSIKNDIVAVGAPFDRRPSPEVQVITIMSDDDVESNEVHSITVMLNKTLAITQIWRLSTLADRETLIGGYFSIVLMNSNSYVSAEFDVPSNIGPAQLSIFIENVRPDLSPVTTSRHPNKECNCSNAWVWDITFTDNLLTNATILVQGSKLEGLGALVADPIALKSLDVLNGTFSLKHGFPSKGTRPIPFDASSIFLREVIETDFGLPVVRVSSYNTDRNDNLPELGRTWIVTYSGNSSSYGVNMNIADIHVDNVDLSGASATVTVNINREGISMLGGEFSLSMQSEECTPTIPFNATNETMKAALEQLNAIHNVLIDGPYHFHEASNRYGYRWFVTFVSINLDSDEEWRRNPYCSTDGCNIENLTIQGGHLFGNNVQYTVDYEIGAGIMDTRAQELRYKMGNAGIKGGSVTVYHKITDQYIYETMLTSKDADSFDLFGYSLSQSYSHILVGAPGKENSFGAQFGAAYLFQRLLDCSKPVCKYRWSEQIKFTPPELSRNTPEFGFSVAIDISKENGDEQIAVIGAPSANDGRGEVYVFRGSKDNWELADVLSSLVWDEWRSGDRFGETVRISSSTILVGSPGARNGKGIVYTFVESVTSGTLKPFLPSQMIFYAESMSGDNFGSALDVNSNTCVICAPHALDRNNDETGSCYVYIRESPVMKFYLQQILIPSHVSHKDQFGIDVAMSETSNRIIVGQLQDINSDNCNEDKLCSSKSRTKARGKSHVFDFVDDVIWIEQAFLFPTQYQFQDMFGAPVAIHNNIAVVGSSNRELRDIYSGSAIVFDLALLDFSFKKDVYNVNEGGNLNLVASRRHLGRSLNIRIRSMDRNAGKQDQEYLNDLVSLRSTETFPNFTTIYDSVYQTSAYGRRKDNSESYIWLNGMFDTRGISDYEAFHEEYYVDSETSSFNFTLHTFDDDIVEAPNENLVVQISSPGIIASQLGSASAKVLIEDNDGSNSQYTMKVLPNAKNLKNENIEVAVDFDHSSDIVVVGRGFASIVNEYGESVSNAGVVNVYKCDKGHLTQITELSAGSHARSNGQFGKSVAVNSLGRRHNTTILVGSPGQNQAFVFVLDPFQGNWELQGILQPSENLHERNTTFGQSSESISVFGDYAFIGCSATETVYIYRRIFVNGSMRWSAGQVLRSSDFDYDVYDKNFTVKHIHVQKFGAAVAYQNRTLLVGAPFANYGNRGDVNLREKYDTNGIYNKGLGRGKVFLFESPPHIQRLSLQLYDTDNLTSGTFQVTLNDHRGFSTCSSPILDHNITSEELRIALASMACIEEIEVSKSSGTRSFNWNITFSNEVNDNFFLLEPIWHGNGCEICTRFMTNNTSALFTIRVEWLQKQSDFSQTGYIESKDSETSDLFGTSIALDGSLFIVGAQASDTRTRTTWDFETGSLIGWTATGTAFDFQPTFGDNSKFRKGYEIRNTFLSETYESPEASGVKGRFYIGTFEKRPCCEDDYTLPHIDYREGSMSGDEPIGTLTSDGFVILGESISFLIGGGCDHLVVYVELIIDGFPSARSSGRCSERMSVTKWNVKEYIGRTAQIRIVDAGSDKWHHINVDDFHFNWNNNGGPVGGVRYSGQVETPMAGVAYIFKKNCRNGEWKEIQRLEASDKRDGNMFGNSVAIDDKLGIAVVGSSHSPALGFYQEIPSHHPHYREHRLSFPLSERLESYAKADNTLAATGGNLRLINHILTEDKTQNGLVLNHNKHSGAIYIYKRSINRNNADSWKNIEEVKLSPPDFSSFDYFGTSFAFHDYNTLVGAKRSKGTDNEVLYFFNLDWIDISFSRREYHVAESDGVVNITLSRSQSLNISSSLTIGYFTSDLTARGVNPVTFDECISNYLPNITRAECGDYEQSAGIVVFEPGSIETSFQLRIMDDKCKENHLEYIQLQLKVPGGGACVGENFRAQVRIDDDDWTYPKCH